MLTREQGTSMRSNEAIKCVIQARHKGKQKSFKNNDKKLGFDKWGKGKSHENSSDSPKIGYFPSGDICKLTNHAEKHYRHKGKYSI